MFKSIGGSVAKNIYNRELVLSQKINSFLCENFKFPDKDYYSLLDIDGLLKLKSLLSTINNSITTKVSFEFIEWLTDYLTLGEIARLDMLEKINTTKPNTNGFDIALSSPIKIVAEVKCNIPINRGNKYGSNQCEGIYKDIDSLRNGKSKSKFDPSDAVKFLVFLDKPEIRTATELLIQDRRSKGYLIEYADDFDELNKNTIYVVFINIESPISGE